MFSNVSKKCGSVGLFVWSVGYSATNIVCAQGERENAIKSLQEEIKILLEKDVSEEEIGKAIAEIKEEIFLKEIYENKNYCRHIISMFFVSIRERDKIYYSGFDKYSEKTKSGLNVLKEERLFLRERILDTDLEECDLVIVDFNKKIDSWIWSISDGVCKELYATGVWRNSEGGAVLCVEDVVGKLYSHYEGNTYNSLGKNSFISQNTTQAYSFDS